LALEVLQSIKQSTSCNLGMQMVENPEIKEGNQTTEKFVMSTALNSDVERIWTNFS